MGRIKEWVKNGVPQGTTGVEYKTMAKYGFFSSFLILVRRLKYHLNHQLISPVLGRKNPGFL